MVSIFPKGPFPVFPTVIFLGSSSGNQPKTLFRFEEPLNPTVTVLFKFQQEFPFVASLGNVPDLIRNIMSFCPCH